MNTTIGKTVKERMLQLCGEHDLSINRLSIISGVTQSTVNNIAGGRNYSTTVSAIKKPCDGPGITVFDFFDRSCLPNRKGKQKNSRRRDSYLRAAGDCFSFAKARSLNSFAVLRFAVLRFAVLPLFHRERKAWVCSSLPLRNKTAPQVMTKSYSADPKH